MDYQIMKDQLKKVFTSTSTNVDNKSEVDKLLNQKKIRYFIHLNIRITENKIVRGFFSRNNQNFKHKKYNKK